MTRPVHRVDRETVEAEARAVAEIERARADLPSIDPAVFACYLGGLVDQVAEHTEADPVGILASLVCAAGVYLGPGPHIQAGDDRHPLLVWPLVIGRTNAGRKGAGWATAKRLLVAADSEFMTTNIRSGLTSGEGLAAMFADPEPEPSRRPAGTADQPALDGLDESDPAAGPRATDGVTKRPRARHETPGPAGGRLPAGDRRLLVFEPEWAAVMARMRREGNSLSATLRAAWEGGDLSTLNVTARIAPESHVGLVAHIAPGEFAAKVSKEDLAGGTYNRFLPIAVARTRFLPLSQGADPAVVQRIGTQLRDRLHQAGRVGLVGFTATAAQLWRRLYVELGSDTGEIGPVEQFIARTAPNCLRIAAIHAVLDGTDAITTEHLTAAAGLVRYSIASARTVFHGGHGRLLAFITEAGPIGRTKTEITNVVFGKNARANVVDTALAALATAGRIVRTRRAPEGGRGRPVEVYTAGPPEETE